MDRASLYLLPLFAAALVAGAFFLDKQAHAAAEAFYAAALRDAQAQEMVQVDGRIYRVEGGTVTADDGGAVGDASLLVLKLAYAKTLARRAPIFALPGNDPAEMRRLARSLEHLARDIASFQERPEERQLVSEALYPTSFILAMADSEEARGAFLRDGDQGSLDTYLHARENALRAYHSDAERYGQAFVRLVPKTEGRFSLGPLLISYEDMRETVARLGHASAAARARDALERRCMSGMIAYCQPLDLAVLPPDEAPKATVPVDLARADDIATLLRRGPTIPEIQRNLIMTELADPACAPPPGLFIVRPATSTEDGAFFRRLTYVGDLRLVRSETLPEVPFYRYFAERGVSYIPTNPLQHYVCPEFNADAARAFLVESVSEYARRSPLSAHEEGEARNALRALEEDLRRDEMRKLVPEASAHDYLAAAFSLLQRGLLEGEAADGAYALLLEARYHTAGWIDSLQALIDTDSANVRILKKGIPVDLKAAYVFFFRSPLLFLYMSDNPSVSSGLRLAGIPATEQKGEEPYVYYSELPRTKSVYEKLKHDIGIYREVHLSGPGEPIEPLFEL